MAVDCSIGKFVGGYALTADGYFVDGNGCAYRRRRVNSDDYVLELIPGGFAMVETHDGDIAYRDYVTGILWTVCPEDFVQLDFLHFFKYGGLYYLRVPNVEHTIAFHTDDMWISGNAIQRRNALDTSETVFIHRAMPQRVFRFMGYNEDLSKRLLPYWGEMYYYTYKKGGRKPVRTTEKVLPVIISEGVSKRRS